MKLLPFIAPKRYVYKDPDTGVEFKESTRNLLIQRIQNYRLQNRLEPIEYLPTVLENYWCSLPENIGACEPNPFLKRGILPTLRGGVLLLLNMAFKYFATQEEADRRASICIKCPHNTFPDKGKFIKWSDDIALATIGKRRSIHHDLLGNCDICTCVLRAKVFYGDKITLPQDQLDKLPSFCWQKPNGH